VEFRLKITAQARRDFNSIGRYISPEDPAAIGEFGVRLLARVDSLTTFPHRHGSFIGQRNIRKVPFRSYIIYYKIYEEERVVEILRFWHAARDQRRLRLKEEAEIIYGSGGVDPALEPAHLDEIKLRRQNAVSDPGSIVSGDEVLQRARLQK